MPRRTGSREPAPPPPTGAEPDTVPVVVKPGGGSFHHGLTWHGSAPNRSGSVARMALVSHLIPVEARFHETNVDLTYSRYRRRGDLSLDESFFPVLWDESGYRTPWLVRAADALAPIFSPRTASTTDMRKRRNAIGLLVAALAATMLAGTVQALVPSDPQASHPTYAGLNLPAAWDVTSGSPRVVIAIVDTGIDPSHPDLAGAVRVGRDFVDRDDDATNPPGGHGTAVAGVAAARANNGIGGMGTCFSCELMSLRVLGLDGIAFNTNTAAAIDYAVDHGAAVVNASIYGPHSPPTLRNAIVRARAAGVLVVAAAGNEGTSEPQYPAAFPETISVGAAATEHEPRPLLELRRLAQVRGA